MTAWTSLGSLEPAAIQYKITIVVAFLLTSMKVYMPWFIVILITLY